MKLDLHTHSQASDGRAAPREVVRAAEAGGLDVVALADHDTVAGVPEARAAARGSHLLVVPALEISTREPEAEFHILGYFVDPDSPAMLGHQERAADRRTERMHAMIERLQGQGVPVTFQEVLAAADGKPAALGRPHLARALLAHGHVRTFGEAFDRYLRDGGVAFVPTEFPSVRDAVELIRSAGGLPVWAHPPAAAAAELLPRYAAWGLAGVECFRPTTPPDETAELLAHARALNLFPTGGSDWHGVHSGPLGRFWVSEGQVPEMAERCRELAGTSVP